MTEPPFRVRAKDIKVIKEGLKKYCLQNGLSVFDANKVVNGVNFDSTQADLIFLEFYLIRVEKHFELDQHGQPQARMKVEAIPKTAPPKSK